MKNPRGPTNILQPVFFTSAAFVEPLRLDINTLILAYINAYSASGSSAKPMHIFKAVWKKQGWDLFHFRATEPRCRKVFLETTIKLLLERVVNEEDSVFIRLSALFGLYVFYSTQPQNDKTNLVRQETIPIPIDQYKLLLELPSLLPLPASYYATHFLDTFKNNQTFVILPSSTISPHNPSKLPQTIIDIAAPKMRNTRGRPTQALVQARAKRAVKDMGAWLDDFESSDINNTNPTSSRTPTPPSTHADASSSLMDINSSGPSSSHHPPSSSSSSQKPAATGMSDPLREKAAAYTAAKSELFSKVPASQVVQAEEMALSKLRTIDQVLISQGGRNTSAKSQGKAGKKRGKAKGKAKENVDDQQDVDVQDGLRIVEEARAGVGILRMVEGERAKIGYG